MDIKDSKLFGKVIKTYRKAQGLTQEKVANYSNVGTRFIVDLENGKPTCELNKALHVAQMLGIKLNVPIETGDK
jgi:HTH-type transcriptional regulator / antitoxin HipB